MVVPRASLLWKPWPQLRKYSVFDHGPKIADSFGETIESRFLPEFSGRLLSTSKRKKSARSPATVLSHRLHSTVFAKYGPALDTVTRSSRVVESRSRAAVLWR